ncbi:hypothetical protein Tco_0517701 [Tanacetum coccineum]
MVAFPICDELRRSVNSPDWETQFIYYYERSKLDDIRLARLFTEYAILQLRGSLGLNNSMLLSFQTSGTSLLQELARAADSDDIRDQLLVLFTREVVEDTEKMENYRRLSGDLRNGVRMRDKYIRELRTHMSDEVIESIKILKRVQLHDMEKASQLLLMAREIQSKVFEKNTFIARLRD